MKKKISVILAIILCFAMIPNAFAEGENTKTYNTTLTFNEDGTVTEGGNGVLTVDLDKYELVAECGYFEQEENSLVLTKPGFAVGYFSCKNEEQTPGDKIPMPFSINYEVMIVQQTYTEVEGVMTKVDEQLSNDHENDWRDSAKPDFVKPGGGDFEWAFLNVTQEMIDAAGGAFELVFVARAPMYPDTPVAELGQVFSDTFVHLYQEKEVSIGNKDVVGNYVAGNTEIEFVYHVDITWGSLEFTYNQGDVGTWDTDTHTYVGCTESGWTCEEDADKITFTNNSNADVHVRLEYIAAEGYEDIGGAFTDEAGDRIQSLILRNADNHEGENGAGMETVTACHLILSGELTETESAVTIGAVNIVLE